MSSCVRQGCIGRPRVGVTAKLSEGDEGELLIKSPAMFTQ
jgi:long-subunit acyl-CoA synthetase (AMP-forming)